MRRPLTLLHSLPARGADVNPEGNALIRGDERMAYAHLVEWIDRVARGFASLGVGRHERVAIWLPKQMEAVAAMFGASAAGAIFVPVNPALKPLQVMHILRDSGASVLVTNQVRVRAFASLLVSCPALRHLVLTDTPDDIDVPPGLHAVAWRDLLDAAGGRTYHGVDVDPVAILYTSGSTGRPKGVVLSHRNLVAGAESVAGYLGNSADDRLLAVLPFSFDYGLSQLTTAFLTGASVVLLDYLLPRDVVRAVERFGVTGLAAVPALWIRLAALDWPADVATSLRYLTNSGGVMPGSVLRRLRENLPHTSIYLMYGLTEAFRSTYLPPDQVVVRPTSMGRAVPNAEVLVVRPDGTECAPGELGELVHRGAFVSLGYWNDPARTAERFRPLPANPDGLPIPETAVWSGDTVMRDAEGYLYFVGRRDGLIKTSGYRVSPTEIEEAVDATGMAAEVVAVGVPDAILGEAIAVVAVPHGAEVAVQSDEALTARLVAACHEALPAWMVPKHVEWRTSLPRNANGKLDRQAVIAACIERYGEHVDE